jgi:hypothetical protein
MRVISGVVLALLVAANARAQSGPAVFGGYVRADPDLENVHLFVGDLNGWTAGVVVPVVAGFDVVGRADFAYGSVFRTGVVVRPTGTARPWFYFWEIGPRYAPATIGRITPVVQGLIGVTHGQVGTMGVDFLGTTTDTRFEGGVDGGGVVHLRGRVSVQGLIGYRRSQVFDQRFSRVHVGVDAVWALTKR